MLKELFVASSTAGKLRTGISKQAREPANYALWYFIGLPLILAFSSFFSWNNVIFPVHAIPMAAGCGLAYLFTWLNQNRWSSHLSYRSAGLSILFLTAAFILLLTVISLVRLYYSRTFLVSSYLLSISWFVVGHMIFGDTQKKLLVIKGGISDKLKDLTHANYWSFTDGIPGGNYLQQYDALVIDMHVHDNPGLLKQIADASLHQVPVRHAASVFEEYSGRSDLDYLAHEGFYDLVKEKMYLPLKRFWETLLILCSSFVVLPLAGLTALCIKLESEGPVFFTQQRVGKDGKLFTLYKFRSMEKAKKGNGAQFADEDDSRVTKVGRFIRKYRIDEVPQFWNVLKGEMSLIGPRPEQPDFVKIFNEEIPFYSYRHKVRPGITGWAQNKNGYADGLESTRRKLEYDLYYVKNISLSLDTLIVYATIKTILTGFGAR